MKYILLFILFIGNGSIGFESCAQEPKSKIQFKSGNFSDIDYIMITKTIKRKKEFMITIDCNHYISNLGKTLFLKKAIYKRGRYVSTWHLIKDTAMFNNMDYTLSQVRQNYVFIPLTEEEYKAIETAFLKYPALTNKYALNAVTLKDYLGWFEIKQ